MNINQLVTNNLYSQFAFDDNYIADAEVLEIDMTNIDYIKDLPILGMQSAHGVYISNNPDVYVQFTTDPINIIKIKADDSKHTYIEGNLTINVKHGPNFANFTEINTAGSIPSNGILPNAKFATKINAVLPKGHINATNNNVLKQVIGSDYTRPDSLQRLHRGIHIHNGFEFGNGLPIAHSRTGTVFANNTSGELELLAKYFVTNLQGEYDNESETLTLFLNKFQVGADNQNPYSPGTDPIGYFLSDDLATRYNNSNTTWFHIFIAGDMTITRLG